MEMWVHFYAEQLARLHKHGSHCCSQPQWCWRREVISATYEREKSSGIVLIHCRFVRQSEGGRLSGREHLVKCCVVSEPDPSLSAAAAATAGLFLPTGSRGSFSVFKTMKNGVCMTSGSLNRLINNRGKLLMWNCSTYRLTDSMWRKLVFCTNKPVLHEAVLYFHFNKRALRNFTSSITLLPLSFGFSMQTFHKLACSHWIIPGHNRELTHCVQEKKSDTRSFIFSILSKEEASIQFNSALFIPVRAACHLNQQILLNKRGRDHLLVLCDVLNNNRQDEDNLFYVFTSFTGCIFVNICSFWMW